MPDDPEFLTPQQVADRLRVVKAPTIRAWIRAGRLPAHRIGPKRFAVKWEDVQSLIRENEQK